MDIQGLILNALIHDRSYIEKVLPFIKGEYFDSNSLRLVFRVIKDAWEKYGNPPTVESLLVQVEEDKTLGQEEYDTLVKDMTGLLSKPTNTDANWLIDQTERWCQRQAIYNALSASVAIWQGTKKGSIDSIPSILQDALSVSFNTDIGLDYDDHDEIFQRLNNVTKRIPFDIDILNKITGGGFGLKTLNIVQASMGVGKSAFLCNYAASQLRMQRNVLYISMEMSEESIATRIDANLFNISFDKLAHIHRDKALYVAKRTALQRKGLGKLYIKEYAPGAASDKDFDHLLTELYNKKDRFRPDIICIDYLGICKSSRVSMAAGSYAFQKAISEELRALAVRHNAVVLTAIQTNRDGIDSTSISLRNVADSIGIAATADWILGIVSLEEQASQDRAVCTQLKNRYSSIYGDNHTFHLGYCRDKSQFFDIEQDDDKSTSTPHMDEELIKDTIKRASEDRRGLQRLSDFDDVDWG